MTKDYRAEEIEIGAAYLAVFKDKGSGTKDGNEWKWEVSPIPGLYLIIWIENEEGRWSVCEPDTNSKDYGPDLESLLLSTVSQLRDVWVANPHPALRLFFGDLLREVR